MSKTIRGGAISAFNEIIKLSPVDTGRFRGNWQASINVPKQDVLYTDATSAITKTDDVVSHTQSYTLDDTLYLTNNLPYAAPLENGHSKKRGSGWVAAVCLEAKIRIQNNLDQL